MTLTLLIDMDDTLLDNSMDSFLPPYLQRLGMYMQAYAAPENLIRALMQATNQMMANRSPEKTLEAVFGEHFYPALKLNPEDTHSFAGSGVFFPFQSFQPSGFFITHLHTL